MVGTITVSNSTVTYAWNTGETTASINVTPTTNTTYTVTATDGNCTTTDDVGVTLTPFNTVTNGAFDIAKSSFNQKFISNELDNSLIFAGSLQMQYYNLMVGYIQLHNLILFLLQKYTSLNHHY